MAVILKKRNNSEINFFIDLLLSLIFVFLALSGLLIQIKYHAGHSLGTDRVCGLNRAQWLVLHKILSVFLAMGVTIHGIQHISWFQRVLRMAANFRSKTTKITLLISAIFTCSAATGFIAWLLVPTSAERNLTELHDKISLLLIILFVMHLANHRPWILKNISNRRQM